MARKTKTPQYKRKVVDIRVAAAKKLSIRFLDEMGIPHNDWDALTLVRDIITFYDPTNPQRNHEYVEKVMAKYQPLASLIPWLKEQKLI